MNLLAGVNCGIAAEDDTCVGMMHAAGFVFFRSEKCEVNDSTDFLVVVSAIFNIVDRDFLIDQSRVKPIEKTPV